MLLSVAMLEMLQSQPRITGSVFARNLDIDPRTVRRYIATLIDMGMPVVAERGRDGAYCLARGFKLPPMMFKNDEAVALGMGLLALRQLGLAAASSAVMSAEAKLERVMPVALQARLHAMNGTVMSEIQGMSSAMNSQLFASTVRAYCAAEKQSQPL
jgi:predicted DNA-binding transcriptional regulator YafY